MRTISLYKLLAQTQKKGQSTVEFAMVIFMFLFMLAMTFSAVVGFATHQYFSYATFMSARAYQAGRANEDAQREAAVDAMSKYIPGINSDNFSGDLPFSFGGIQLATIKSFRVPNGAPISAGGGPQTGFGIVLEFEIPFLRIPMGQALRDTLGKLNMRTVSYLGREVTVEECKTFFVNFFNGVRKKGGGNPHTFAAMEDTGC